MFSRWVPVVLASALVVLVANDESFSNPQEILGRRYSQEAGRLFKTDHNGEEWTVAPGVILVRFSPGASAVDISNFQQSNQLWPAPRLTANAAGYRQFRFATDRDPLDVLIAVVAEELVQDACLDTEIKFFGDPYFGNQWNLQKMRADKAWEITRGDSSIVIAIIDSGVDYEHEDLIDAMWRNPNDAYGDGVDGDNDSAWYGSPMVDDFTGWDFRNNDNKPLPDTLCMGTNPCSATGQYHGTSVAGVALAIRDNDIGVAGACGARGANGPRLMTLRVYNQSGSSVADAIEYAWRKGATVVNMSFGINDENADGVAAELDTAAAHGVIVVAAVGNTLVPIYPVSRVFFPASYPSVIAVGATDENDLHWRYSCMGPELDLVAPSGGNDSGSPYHFTELWTTDTYRPLQGSANPESCGGCPPGNNKYYSHFGYTSAASPEVASIAALLKSHMPGLTPTQVRQRLIDSAVDLGDAGPDTLYGYGRVDAYRALTEWGTITGDVTWSPSDTQDGARYISGDLTIASGATLTIMPGTVVRIANDDDLRSGVDTLRIEINVDGSLVAAGTAANPIVFESWTPTTTEDWAGFYFSEDGDGGTFSHCTISRAEIAIDSYAPIELNGVVIDSTSDAGISIWSSTLDVDHCTISNSDGDGIRVDQSDATIDSTIVEGCVGYGLHMSGNGALNISHSTFQDSDTGVYVESNTTNGLISETRFVNNDDSGISYYYSIKPTIDECLITGNGNGIRLDHFSGPTILHCMDSASYDGDIGSNAVGIFCTEGSNPDIGYCDIHNNNTGVGAFDESVPDLEGNGPNKLRTHSAYHIASLDPTVMIPAEGNYWSANTGNPNYYPKSTKILGWVDYQNALSSAPNPTSPWPGREPEETPKPLVTGLGRAHPNPFNPTIHVPFTLSAAADVQIDIYDVAGRLVRTLVHERRDRGEHVVVWDGMTNGGSATASAVYFVRMRIGQFVETQKIVLLK